MRRLLWLVPLLSFAAARANAQCASTSYGQGVTCVQQNTVSTATTLASVAYTLSGVNVANAIILENSACDNGTCTAATHTMSIAFTAGSGSCTASHNSPFTNAVSGTFTFKTYVWLCTGLSAGTITLTVTYSANDFFTNGGISEWNWPKASAAVFDAANVDASNGAISTNPTVTAGGADTNAVDLIYAANVQASTVTPTVGAGYTEVSNNVNGIEIEAKTVSALGTQTATWTSASQSWITIIAPIIVAIPGTGGGGIGGTGGTGGKGGIG